MSRGGIGSSSAAAANKAAGRQVPRTAEEIYASFDEDPQDLVSASLDAEFEGGQFINGEFYYGAQKARRPMSKAEMIYGFDEEADREFYAAQSRPQKSRAKGKAAGGIAFVLGATIQPEANAKQQREAQEAAAKAAAAAQVADGAINIDEADNAEDVSFQDLRRAKTGGATRNARQRERDELEEAERSMAGRGLGLGARPSPSPSPPAAAAAPISRPPPAKLDKDFAAFNKHGTGFGLRMLSAFGFRPGEGLGKRATGVVQPIIAQLRPNMMGLMTRNQTPAEEERERRKLDAPNKQDASQDKSRAGWKKDTGKAASAKPKRVYKTAAEVLAADTQQVGAVTPLVVMDYRGATAKATSLDQVSSVAPIADVSSGLGPAPQMLPELQHNLRLLVSLAEEELRGLERDRQAAGRRMDQLLQQKDHIETGIMQDEERITVLDRIVQQIEEVAHAIKAIPKSAPNSLHARIALVVKMLTTLRKGFPKEYDTYEIAHRSLPMVYPLVKGLLFQWEPLADAQAAFSEKRDASHKSALELLSEFKFSLLTPMPSHATGGASSTSIYERLLEELLLPKLRLELSQTQQCSMRRHAAMILTLMRQIEPVCTTEVYLYVVSHLIYPKLAHEVSAWNPRTDPQPIHEWVLPYAKLIPSHLLAKVYDAIRLKLSITLQEWDAMDHSAIHVIAPWATHFRPDQFDALMQRSILPKLEQLLKHRLQVQPANQDLSPFLAVVPWAQMLATTKSADGTVITFSSATTLRDMFVRDFFPKWFRALYTWLGGASVSAAAPSTADFDEVSAWYRGWKSHFPSSLAADAGVQQCFSKGLDLINQALNEQDIQERYQQITNWLQAPSTTRPQTAARANTAAPAAATLPSASRDNTLDSDADFLEMILQFATHHGVEFVPHLKKGPVHGKQVYLFGRSQVYASKGVVYTKPDAGTDAAAWTPIALADLLARAQNQSKASETKTGPAAPKSRAPEQKTTNTASRNEDVD